MKLNIAAIKARADKATAGPWTVETPLGGPSVIADGHKAAYDWSFIAHADTGKFRHSIKAERNADFIAHARTDIPALIAALEASEAARVKAEQENGSLAAWQCIHHDGKTGIVCTEHGHQICAKDARITALEAERDALMKAAYLKGRTEWCPAGILDDTERTERDWRDARRALEASK